MEERRAADLVNHPPHYQVAGTVEAIDFIESVISDAPHMVPAYLQGQVLKYMIRMWLKGNALQDAKKAEWYLNRLIAKLETCSITSD
jgi:hypothetical protein